jgi:hypothetical protein
MIKAEILAALPKLSAEERREIRAKLSELDNEAWFDNGELSGQEKAIIEARLGHTSQFAGVSPRRRRITAVLPFRVIAKNDSLMSVQS